MTANPAVTTNDANQFAICSGESMLEAMEIDASNLVHLTKAELIDLLKESRLQLEVLPSTKEKDVEEIGSGFSVPKRLMEKIKKQMPQPRQENTALLVLAFLVFVLAAVLICLFGSDLYVFH